MRLRIDGIFDRGVSQRERLQLTALVDANLNYYLVFDSEYVVGGISTAPKNVLWLPNYLVKAGHIIVLYTGPGTASVDRRADGGLNHFLYWGLGSTIWHSPTSCAVVIEISTWNTSPAR